MENASWRSHGGEQHLYIYVRMAVAANSDTSRESAYVWWWRLVMWSNSATSAGSAYDGGGRSCDPTRPHLQNAHMKVVVCHAIHFCHTPAHSANGWRSVVWSKSTKTTKSILSKKQPFAQTNN
jgi:hypothetical protein